MQRLPRLVITLGMAASLFLLIGARCVENDALRRGPEGNWHVVGELFNETDVQGVAMEVRGEIFDANGTLLSAATAPTCPGELSPGKPVAYDIEFPGTKFLPQPASYKVTVAKGRAVEATLPELNITPELKVVELPENKLKIGVRFGPAPGYEGFYKICLAFYDGAGKMTALPAKGVFAQSVSGLPFEFNPIFFRADIPGAAWVRIWIFAVDTVDAASSPFQTYVSFPLRLPLDKTVGATPQVPFPLQ